MTELDAYLEFRKEIDTMFYPKFARLNNVLTKKDEKGNVVALLIVEGGEYINALWVAPKYRKHGIGSALVKEYIFNYQMPESLVILNNNKTAYAFWNKIFKLKPDKTNPYDTLYWIEGLK